VSGNSATGRETLAMAWSTTTSGGEYHLLDGSISLVQWSVHACVCVCVREYVCTCVGKGEGLESAVFAVAAN